MIKYTIATNFDSKLVEGYNQLNEKYQDAKITEIFGSLPVSVVGSGRSASSLPNITKEELKKHIELAHVHGILFNYLLNAKLNWKELDLNKVTGELDSLLEAGIDSVTLSDYRLIRLIREKYPTLPINVSTISGVDTFEEATEYDKLGVRSITLNFHTINRNLKKIEEIVKGIDCKIVLYANSSCLDHCAVRNTHYDYLGRLSRKESRLEVDPFILWCTKRFLKDQLQLLKNPFIRPEDVKEYQNLGVDTFKLSDRREPTECLLELAGVYLAQEYRGNLFTLLFRGEQVRKMTSTLGNIPVAPPRIHIDNTKLTQIDFFKE